MIFNQLLLQNFGQYKGLHRIDLSTSKTKPVLLIGGLNGGGKTTILDAMQLCLYGKRSNCYRRSDQRWDEYLQNWINRNAANGGETRIKLTFRHPHNGADTEFRVECSWRATGKSIKERKEIFVNDVLNESITASWDRFIDGILPAKLSTLFFFDGEQIETLVRPDTAQQFLESAVTELLGIGAIEQLSRDLDVLNRNKNVHNKDSTLADQLHAAESDYGNVQKKACHLEEHCCILRRQLTDAKKDKEILESEYESKGGKLLDEQSANEKKQGDLALIHDDLKGQIIKEQSGILPLQLVREQLLAIKRQAVAEKNLHDCVGQQAQLDRMHKKYVHAAQKSGATELVLSVLDNIAQREKNRLQKTVAATTVYLEMPDHALPLLERVIEELPSRNTHYRQLNKQLENTVSQIATLEARLDATPEGGDLELLLQKRKECTKRVVDLELELQAKEELLEQIRTQANQYKERVLRLLGEHAEQTAEQEDVQRLILYSLHAQKYLARFRQKLLLKHLGALEKYILESFQHLLYKQSLVHRLVIDPQNYSISLTNREGTIIPAEKLSAGERQLLAISIFWGLQKASNRPIPVMIDTPLGRLDSSHRDHLVRRYFPLAAHQVVLFSTDEEIVGYYHEQISPHTYKELLLRYDENNSTSVVEEGYFN
jgi:DNA sulfur modification protein DndD